SSPPESGFGTCQSLSLRRRASTRFRRRLRPKSRLQGYASCFAPTALNHCRARKVARTLEFHQMAESTGQNADIAVAMDLPERDYFFLRRIRVRFGIGQHQLFSYRIVDAVSFHIEVVVVADNKGHSVSSLTRPAYRNQTCESLFGPAADH